jgi:hypothetical protein
MFRYAAPLDGVIAVLLVDEQGSVTDESMSTFQEALAAEHYMFNTTDLFALWSRQQ